ncbi:phosphate-starvation-inducible protein PsiE [Bacillus sp. sid0103]|uniref:phosphate-starvation-inducible protein PsiE n=1 Tax=Bacillus sp. sid0103 TaxID=2856337 RepID=UPI001C43F225|nr:phosphate-starvation-inducible protein PsiE [Bacillus sp. sid0103]MBV7508954.1 phosphate-starvation-inducible protein PsiE [Bacillus sp. sid0103]
MKQRKKDNRFNIKLATVFQYALNTALVLLAIVLCILLGKEIIYFVRYAFFNHDIEEHYKFLESILVFFLYFELIALIVKYFEENYHFPLRYFLYIGITALIRLIVVYHDSPINTILYSGAILVLVISFYILNSAKEKHEKI